MNNLEKITTTSVADAVAAVLARHAGDQAETMAEELLAEPEFRAQMQALLRQAFKKAMEGLLAE